MKVILLQNVKGLGRAGDIKEVAEGYARNFLFGKKLAEIATGSGMKRVESINKSRAEKERMEIENAKKIALRLEGKIITIAAKAKGGKLFGSIHAKDVAKELKKENIDIEDKAIILKSQIKELGEFSAKVELGHKIEAKIVIVIKNAG